MTNKQSKGNKRESLGVLFCVTRRSGSDSRQFLSPLLIVSTDLTDVTLVSDDTYRFRLKT